MEVGASGCRGARGRGLRALCGGGGAGEGRGGGSGGPGAIVALSLGGRTPSARTGPHGRRLPRRRPKRSRRPGRWSTRTTSRCRRGRGQRQGCAVGGCGYVSDLSAGVGSREGYWEVRRRREWVFPCSALSNETPASARLLGKVSSPSEPVDSSRHTHRTESPT